MGKPTMGVKDNLMWTNLQLGVPDKRVQLWFVLDFVTLERASLQQIVKSKPALCSNDLLRPLPASLQLIGAFRHNDDLLRVDKGDSPRAQLITVQLENPNQGNR